MALKDWKNIYDGSTLKRYKKGKTIIQVHHLGFADIAVTRAKKINNKFKQVHTKSFRNTEAAMKAAKNYMRTH